MPYFVASPCIVSPAAYPCRISSNSSTLALLSIPASFHPGLGVGQIRRSKWAKSDDRTQQVHRPGRLLSPPGLSSFRERFFGLSAAARAIHLPSVLPTAP